MSRKFRYAFAVVGVLTMGVAAAAPSAIVASASPANVVVPQKHKSSGMTGQSVKLALRAGRPSALVSLAPQSAVGVLARATEIGAYAPGAKIELTIGLKLRNQAKLHQFLRLVQYPGSFEYHRWLTPVEFTAQYGPTQSDVARVTAFLEAHGIKVTSVSDNRLLIHAKATATDFEHAFKIRINDYKLDGRKFFGSPEHPMLPRAIAPLISGILGLNRGVRPQPAFHRTSLNSEARTHRVEPSLAPPPVTSQTAYYNQKQLAKAYDWPSLTDTANGTGTTIAVLTYDATDLQASDYHGYWAALGLPDHDVSVVKVGNPDASGGLFTAAYIEYAGGMAPGAGIVVYDSPNSWTSIADSINRMLSDNTADVATIGWANCESKVANITTIDQLFQQAAAQGITVMAASGNGGSTDCGDSPSAEYPASSPYVLAVGGTALTISDPSGTYGSETVMCMGVIIDFGCSGGGPSTIFKQPPWQVGAGVPASGQRL